MEHEVSSELSRNRPVPWSKARRPTGADEIRRAILEHPQKGPSDRDFGCGHGDQNGDDGDRQDDHEALHIADVRDLAEITQWRQ